MFNIDEKVEFGKFFTFLTNNLNLSKSSALSLMSYFFRISKNEVFLNPKKITVLNETIVNTLKRIEAGYPVAYVLKSVDFYGLNIFVDENVLIPRPETEILVDTVLKEYNNKNLQILDLCTGSGCILIALLHNLNNSYGIGLDISFDALRVAKKNSKLYDLNADFIRGDCIYSNNIFKKKFDVIVCNPPYVGYDEIVEESIKYEPEHAIYAKEQGLFFYKKLLSIINKLCKKNGIVCFEIGFKMKNQLIEICKKNKIQPEFIKDYSGNDRVMTWKNL